MRGMTTPDVLYFPWKMTMAQAKYLQLTGNSISGKEAAEMGWVAKSFPADQLEEQVIEGAAGHGLNRPRPDFRQ